MLADDPRFVAAGIGVGAVGIAWSSARNGSRSTRVQASGLAEQLRPVLGPGAEVRQGRRSVSISYTAGFRDYEPAERGKVERIIDARLDGRWRFTWNTTANRLDAKQRPPMPDRVERKHVPGESDRFALGVDEDGKARMWSTVSDCPHLLVAGATGSGKTVLISGLIMEAAARPDWEVWIVDGKGTTLAGFRRWPGVVRTGYGTADSMAPVLQAAEAEVHRRNADETANPEDWPKILLVIDEAAQMTSTLGQAWRQEKPRGGGPAHPAIDAWRSVARLGRENRVHLVMGIQQAAASFFQGTEARDQFGGRLVLGPTTEESAGMMFGRTWVGRDVPAKAKGRATYIVMGDEHPVEIQTYYSPELRKDGTPRDEAQAADVGRWRALAQRAHPMPEPEPEPMSSPRLVAAHEVAEGRTYVIDGRRIGPLTRPADPSISDPDRVVEITWADGSVEVDGDELVEEVT